MSAERTAYPTPPIITGKVGLPLLYAYWVNPSPYTCFLEMENVKREIIFSFCREEKKSNSSDAQIGQ
jgi:hypothetical protein